eukprot:2498134-Prorocentrum_lima.AAC.1
MLQRGEAANCSNPLASWPAASSPEDASLLPAPPTGNHFRPVASTARKKFKLHLVRFAPLRVVIALVSSQTEE